jgi:hypothetical protein
MDDDWMPIYASDRNKRIVYHAECYFCKSTIPNGNTHKPMIRSLLAMALLSALTQAQSCSNTENAETGSAETHTILEGRVIAFTAPDTVQVNQAVTLTVAFEGGTNGCAEPVRLEPEATQMQLAVRAFYRVPNAEQICTMVVPLHEMQLTHTFTQVGSYVLCAGDQSILSTIVVIQTAHE